MSKRRAERVKYHTNSYREYLQPNSHLQLLSPVVQKIFKADAKNYLLPKQ
jgi:hypothetical protein